MRTKKHWSLLLVTIAALLCLFTWSRQAQSSTKISWEYKYLSPGDNMQAEKLLNELGAQGWELIGVVPNMQQGTVYSGGIFYLKRSKP